jgi:hypothetical protein
MSIALCKATGDGSTVTSEREIHNGFNLLLLHAGLGNGEGKALELEGENRRGSPARGDECRRGCM